MSALSPRFFNTTGPCRPDKHYMLPPLRRLPEVRRLVDEERYFVVHAARQTGKTTSMRALAEDLPADGYLALQVSLEASRAWRDRAADLLSEAPPEGIVHDLDHAVDLGLIAGRDASWREAAAHLAFMDFL